MPFGTMSPIMFMSGEITGKLISRFQECRALTTVVLGMVKIYLYGAWMIRSRSRIMILPEATLPTYLQASII